MLGFPVVAGQYLRYVGVAVRVADYDGHLADLLFGAVFELAVRDGFLCQHGF